MDRSFRVVRPVHCSFSGAAHLPGEHVWASRHSTPLRFHMVGWQARRGELRALRECARLTMDIEVLSLCSFFSPPFPKPHVYGLLFIILFTPLLACFSSSVDSF